MSNLFFISDTHFHHKNILTFKLGCGGHLRNFSSVEEMDETIVNNWNSVVRPQDKVYHLGDFSLGKNPSIVCRLNGHKRLVRGNHDLHKLREYTAQKNSFEEVYGVRHFKGCVLSHVPLHPSCLARWGINIHGHLHANVVTNGYFDMNGEPVVDDRYFNVAVERINYTPISVEEVRKITGRSIL